MQKFFRKALVVTSLVVTFIQPSQAADVISHAVILLPDNPRIDDPWVKIIRDQDDWEAHFYATTAAITYPDSMAPHAPVLDFESSQVISGGLGMRSSGGYYLAIESIVELENSMLVHVLSVSPGSGCAVTMAITHPSITILVKKTDKPIKFNISELIHQCDKKINRNGVEIRTG